MGAKLEHFVSFGRKILGAGLNYKSLVEARHLTCPEKPIIFLKPTSSYIQEGQSIKIPLKFNVHEEVELGVIIGKRGKNISPCEAMDYVGGYCLALDLTDVDDMKRVRALGHPWTFGKGFDTACPVSKFIPCDAIPDINSVCISCDVNGKTLQKSNLSDMIFSIEDLIAYCSKYMTLEPCDLILTGTPAGSGPITPGDTVVARLNDLVCMKFPVKLPC